MYGLNDRAQDCDPWEKRSTWIPPCVIPGAVSECQYRAKKLKQNNTLVGLRRQSSEFGAASVDGIFRACPAGEEAGKTGTWEPTQIA